MVERIPPHNMEAERSVLGACMLDKEALGDIISEVKKDDFYDERNREIYSAIFDLYKDNKAVDVVTVSEELKKRKALEISGGRTYIATLTANVASTANALDYAKIVSEKSMLRSMIKTTEDVMEKGYSQEIEASEILDYAERSIFTISQRHQRKDYMNIQEILLKNLETIEEISKNPDKLTGVPTGFRKLDEMTNGFQRSDLIIIAARPSMGKTAFALNVALQSAIKGKASVLIFSLEMDEEQLGMRLLSMQSRVESEKISKGKLETSDWERLSMGTDEMQKAHITIDATPGIGMLEIKNKCRRKKATEEGLDMIIVDYLQLMGSDTKVESRQQEITTLSRQFKQLAREMDCPVILLSQLNRGPDLRQNDHRPNLSDLRESGSIEQDADIVMFLYRDDYYYPDTTEKPGVCEVIIAKNRKGPTGKVELTWVSSYTKFSEQAF